MPDGATIAEDAGIRDGLPLGCLGQELPRLVQIWPSKGMPSFRPNASGASLRDGKANAGCLQASLLTSMQTSSFARNRAARHGSQAEGLTESRQATEKTCLKACLQTSKQDRLSATLPECQMASQKPWRKAGMLLNKLAGKQEDQMYCP